MNLTLDSLPLEQYNSLVKRKNQAAATLGRKGGKQRAANRGWENIPEEQRREVARNAARARWAKEKKKH